MHTVKTDRRPGLARKALSGVVATVEVIFDGCVEYSYTVISCVNVNRTNPGGQRSKCPKFWRRVGGEQSIATIYEKGVCDCETENPRMGSFETSLFHGNGRSISGIPLLGNKAAAFANLGNKAFNESVRVLARNVMKKIDEAARNVFAKDVVGRHNTTVKDK